MLLVLQLFIPFMNIISDWCTVCRRYRPPYAIIALGFNGFRLSLSERRRMVGPDQFTGAGRLISGIKNRR